MNKIASFTVNHDKITEGIYVSRIDGDITTYDMRMRQPNMGDYIDNLTIHSLEHMFATYVRNSEKSDKIIYFGPMGCQTGFYLLVRDESNESVLFAVFLYRYPIVFISVCHCSVWRFAGNVLRCGRAQHPFVGNQHLCGAVLSVFAVCHYVGGRRKGRHHRYGAL